MDWWVWLVLICVAGGSLSAFSGVRNRRARIVVRMPESSPPTIQLTTLGTVEPGDLCLLALCYASKVHWLLLSEMEPSRDLFREFCAEALDFWDAPGADLIDRMPTARALRDDPSVPHAVPGGERFVITLYRTDYRSLKNRVWVNNSLPRSGMAANIPWSALVVLNAAFALLDPETRVILHRAFSGWYDFAFEEWEPDQSMVGLNALFASALGAYTKARAAA